ncbi:protein VTE6 [Populus alba x Populus x berolinensis]|nr:protein VTE6 [Populus alba x Populus x berolinensis]
MAQSTLLHIKHPYPFPPLHFSESQIHPKKPLILTSTPSFPTLKFHKKMIPHRPHAVSVQGVLSDAMNLIQSAHPTWKSALFSNLLIFVVGSPILVSGLSISGIFAAYLLGTLTWRAFGPSGFLLVASYFVIGTAVTKVKMAQKEAQGVAEKRKGRRGPGSVIGSSAAGCVCAFLSIFGIGGRAFLALWQLGFVASFCTKLSDTVSSEIGKAYGKTTYLVTTFKVVPRGTEGAVSAEGTLAGLLASILLASIGCILDCVVIAKAMLMVIVKSSILDTVVLNFYETLPKKEEALPKEIWKKPSIMESLLLSPKNDYLVFCSSFRCISSLFILFGASAKPYGPVTGFQIGVASSSSKQSILALNRIRGDFTG